MKEDISRELERIEEDAKYSSKGHFEAASTWRHCNYWLGVPSAIGAGVAGVAAFNNLVLVSGIVAIFVAALTSVSTFLDPSARANEHRVSGTSFLALKNQARILRTIDLKSDDAKVTQQFRELAERRDTLNSESPEIPPMAYRRAKAGIERGEAAHIVDEG
jgi:hypothetical protein